MRETDANPLICAAEKNCIPRMLKKYLKRCEEQKSESDSKKEVRRLPTLAGFCAMLNCGLSAADMLRNLFPLQYDYICAVLEDEALNSARSPTVLNTYLKERLGYGQKSDADAEESPLQPIFEHDILGDGA